MLDDLPSINQMFKLVVVLILALVAVAIVVKIVKLLIPLIIVGALVVGGYYLYQKMQSNEG